MTILEAITIFLFGPIILMGMGAIGGLVVLICDALQEKCK